MRVTVLVSTYNGEEFIEEQLRSLLNQSVKVDEVLIRDDCSNDSTCELIRSFICKNGLDNWSFIRNEFNLGFRANFRSLANAASGDVVFFCDQDDVWGEHKIEACLAVFDAQPDIDLVCTDFIASGDQRDVERLDAGVLSGDLPIERVYPHLGKPYVWLGCAMAVRFEFMREVMPYWSDVWAHDECMWCMAQVAGGCAILHERHLWHREHAANATGKKVHDRKRRMELLDEKCRGYAEVVRFCQDKGIIGKGSGMFEGMRDCEQARVTFLHNPSIGKAAFLLRHLRYYPELKSYFVDVLIAFRA